MTLLQGKRILVTGIITDSSIAFHIAKHCQLHGAKVILTAYGRPSLVKAIAKRLPERPPVIELDVQSEDDLAALADRWLRSRRRQASTTAQICGGRSGLRVATGSTSWVRMRTISAL